MATSLQLQPPGPFSFENPEGWPRWKRRFKQFHSASGLASASHERQTSTLLYCLGEEAEDVLQAAGVTDADRATVDTLLKKFDAFFATRKNVIFERARFNLRAQQPGESAEQYIIALYTLVESCEYGSMKEELIRDRLVVGILDSGLSEKLQLDSTLDLEKAKKAIRLKEAVQESQRALRQAGDSKDNPVKLDAVGTTPRNAVPKKQYRNPRGAGKHCSRCGGHPHPLDKCPAREAVCYRCQKRGHYSARCFSNSNSVPKNAGVATDVVEAAEDEPEPTAYLDVGAVNTESRGNSWTTTIRINKADLTFKLDTGAEVTAISDQTHHLLGKPALRKPSKVLYGPGRNRLNVLGELTQELSYGDNQTNQVLFVVEGLSRDLLGLPAITALGLIARTDAIADSHFSAAIVERYESIFQGLGRFGEPYTIKLRPDAKPVAIYTPRRVPFPLRSQVKEELARMEALGVISQVDQPTDWCSGMVAVPKKSGSVRICVDLQRLNESVLREVHPLPRVEETLAQLAGAKVFSKLDANSGFWQIPLEEESRLLTTFLTPFGRFCFNKLPFGICSASEHFQKQMSRLLEGLEGVVCQVDDVLVHAPDQKSHDARLNAVLTRMKEKGVTLNREKCSFSQTQLKFLGHMVDEHGVSPDPDKTAAV